jgi:hypothetical protein
MRTKSGRLFMGYEAMVFVCLGPRQGITDYSKTLLRCSGYLTIDIGDFQHLMQSLMSYISSNCLGMRLVYQSSSPCYRIGSLHNSSTQLVPFVSFSYAARTPNPQAS